MNAVTTHELAALQRQGLYEGLPIDEYHGGPGISKTGLDDIERSPAIFHAFHIDPARPARVERAGQLEGSLAHCAILEPAEFTQRYATLPADAPRRPTPAQWGAKNPSDDSRAAMAWWSEWNERHAGATVISADQYEAAQRQADSVRRLPEVAEALAQGRAEVSAYWRDPVTGVLCRCRPDWVHEPNDTAVILLDVKTCGDASPEDFARQIARKRYHVQDAFYSDGYALASGREVLGFVFVAVESAWPFAASAVVLDEPSRDQGRRDYRRNLNTYSQCLESGVWPGFSHAIEVVSIPHWAFTE